MTKATIAAFIFTGGFFLFACGGGGNETPERTAYSELTGALEKQPEPNFQPSETYRSSHDPDAFYTMDTVILEGSYLKVDFRDLTPDQFNRIIHRAKTEKSTCGSGFTIDECLINRPHCTTAQTLIKQIVREEKLKG